MEDLVSVDARAEGSINGPAPLSRKCFWQTIKRLSREPISNSRTIRTIRCMKEN